MLDTLAKTIQTHYVSRMVQIEVSHLLWITARPQKG